MVCATDSYMKIYTFPVFLPALTIYISIEYTLPSLLSIIAHSVGRQSGYSFMLMIFDRLAGV